jgi:hypothetical protein
MAGTNLIYTLTTLYAKLLGELEFADRSVMDTGVGLAAFDEAILQVGCRKREINEKLAAIETVIWMFDADWDPSAIRPNYPRKRHVKPGSISRAAYGVLREAKTPMTTREISRVVASRLGNVEPDERGISRIEGAIYQALMKRVGVTLEIAEKDPIRWSLIPRDQVRSRAPVPRVARAA